MNPPRSLWDNLMSQGVERVRIKRSPGGTIRRLAAPPDGDWEDADALLDGLGETFAAIEESFRLGHHERLDLVLRTEVGLRFICAVHSTRRGPGAGGLRRHDLVTDEMEVIQDVLDLSRAMTYKNAAAELPRGGSKLCVHNPPLPSYDRASWLRVLAEEVDLSGTITGPDTGFATVDYEELAALSDNVTGVRGGGTSASAALGVHEALQATAAALGRPLNETHLLIQGLGHLGESLARRLASEGARLTVTDKDHGRIDGFLKELTPAERRSVEVVAPYQVLEVPVDILCPCATGGLIGRDAISSLSCSAICGGANNQLKAHSLEEERELAHALQDAGKLYIPDWLASAGGTIHGVMEAEAGAAFDPRKVQARVRRVCGWLVDRLLDSSKKTGRPPLEIAVEEYLQGVV